MAVSAVVLFGLLGSLVLFGPGVIAAIVARYKGYRPWFWLLSAGPFGTLSILLRPSLSRATTPEERERWEQNADWTGAILSGITFFSLFALPMVAMVGFVSYRSVAVMAPPVAIPAPVPPAQYVTDEPSAAESPAESLIAPRDSEEVRSPLEPAPGDSSK